MFVININAMTSIFIIIIIIIIIKLIFIIVAFAEVETMLCVNCLSVFVRSTY